MNSLTGRLPKHIQDRQKKTECSTQNVGSNKSFVPLASVLHDHRYNKSFVSKRDHRTQQSADIKQQKKSLDLTHCSEEQHSEDMPNTHKPCDHDDHPGNKNLVEKISNEKDLVSVINQAESVNSAEVQKPAKIGPSLNTRKPAAKHVRGSTTDRTSISESDEQSGVGRFLSTKILKSFTNDLKDSLFGPFQVNLYDRVSDSSLSVYYQTFEG